jgi:hypothetical protein
MFALVALVILTGGYELGLDPVIAGSDRARRCIEPVALLALTAAAAWVWTIRAPGRNLSFDRAAPAAWPVVGVISIVAFAATAITARYILHEYPMSGDEYAYLFQSWIFELGKLWIQPWPLDKYLDTFFISHVGGKLLSTYPPGWPAVLAAASTAGIPSSLVNPILAAGTIPVLYVLPWPRANTSKIPAWYRRSGRAWRFPPSQRPGITMRYFSYCPRSWRWSGGRRGRIGVLFP